jgi:hypothetical protein
VEKYKRANKYGWYTAGLMALITLGMTAVNYLTADNPGNAILQIQRVEGAVIRIISALAFVIGVLNALYFLITRNADLRDRSLEQRVFGFFSPIAVLVFPWMAILISLGLVETSRPLYQRILIAIGYLSVMLINLMSILNARKR